jgi:hypothetical protein
MIGEFERRLAAAPATARTWVASSEHVVPYMTIPARIETFDALLKRYFDEVTYAVYLRRPEDLIVSSYSESVRRGNGWSFEDFVKHFLEHGEGDHMAILRMWMDVVGKDRLAVRLFEPDALVGGDVVDDFCAIVGASAQGLKRPPVQNRSLTQKALGAFLLINRHICSESTADPQLQALRTRLCRVAEDWGADGPALALPDEVRDSVRDALAASNEDLRATFFPERAELFPAKAGKVGAAAV